MSIMPSEGILFDSRPYLFGPQRIDVHTRLINQDEASRYRMVAADNLREWSDHAGEFRLGAIRNAKGEFRLRTGWTTAVTARESPFSIEDCRETRRMRVFCDDVSR